MEQDRKIELINLAIQKLIQDNRNKETTRIHDGYAEFLQTNRHNDDDAEYQLALSQLLSLSLSHSELEMLKGDEILLEQSEASGLPPEVVMASAIQKRESKNVDAGEEDGGCRGRGTDEIVKELKEVKRQNFVTHCLLSVMIVLTVAWQLSEVSLIMKVKDGLSHPFRSFASIITGMLKVPDLNGQEANNKERQPENSTLPSLGIPEMPHVDVPNLGLQ